ncbi:MAG TPA: cupin domain-containing protein [Dongiaceae bacterium]|nr:cupin domain-containing protein [Dongiaceae bacterium]
MKSSLIQKRMSGGLAAILILSATVLGAPGIGSADEVTGTVIVSYVPGGRSPKHHHAGSVLAYVLRGAIRSENSATGAVRVYQAGESFFEPAGSTHIVSENASTTEPARLLAVFVADDGAHLTTIDK